jgi:hypothetical protein
MVNIAKNKIWFYHTGKIMADSNDSKYLAGMIGAQLLGGDVATGLFNSYYQGNQYATAAQLINLTGGATSLGGLAGGGTSDGTVGPGAMNFQNVSQPLVKVNPINGQSTSKDLRTKIRVPGNYLSGGQSGGWLAPELGEIGGIIFPYTPTISFESKADYSAQTPMHSNYTQYFYKNSSVAPITITGKFSVQNDKDARVYIATITLLRALTKMLWGNDANAGSPPPICRLDAYGELMFKNVPVAITNFRTDLPNTVDYFTLDKKGGGNVASVPTLSEISVTCIPVYSRREILNYNVTGYLGSGLRGKGYL